MRIAGRLLLILFLLILVCWAAVRLFVLTPAVAEKVRVAVEEAARESLTEPLTIERVKFDLPGRVVVEGVRLGPPGGSVLEAPSAIVHLNLFSLARNPREPGLALKGLTLVGPELRLARDGEGAWNFLKLAKPPEPGAKPVRLSLVIRIRDGRIRVEGAEVPGSKSFKLFFEKTTGRVAIGGGGEVRWKLRTETDFAPGLRVSGRYYGNNGWSLRVGCSRLSLAKFPSVLLPQGLKIGGEVRRLDVTLMPGVGGRFPLAEGGLELRDVSVESEDFKLPVSGIGGGVRFEGSAVRLEGVRAEAGGGEIEIGGVALVPRGGVALSGRVDGLSLDALSKSFGELKGAGLRGKVSGAFDIGGSLKAPSAVVEVEVERPAYGKSAFDRAGFELLYSNKVFSISGAEISRGDGVVAVEGMFRASEDWKDWKGGLSIQLDRMRSSDIPAELGMGGKGRISGMVSGTIVAAKDFGGPLLVSGSVRGDRLEMGSYPEPATLEAVFRGDGAGWTIENLILSEGENFVAASGAVGSGGELSVDVDGCGWDAARLASVAGEGGLPVYGWLECSGGVRGTIKEMAADFGVRGYDLAFDTIRGLTLNGDIRKNEEGWFSSLKLFNRSVSVEAEVEVAAGGAVVSIEASGLPLKSLAESLRTAGVADFSYWNAREGAVSCEVDAAMKGGAWEVSGSAVGERLLVYGENVERVSVDFSYDSVLALRGGRMKIGGDEVGFGGELSGEGMRLDIVADAIELADINLLSAYQVAGRAGFEARFEGPYGETALEGKISPSSVELRGVSLSAEGGSFGYHGGVLTLGETVARRGEEIYTVEGSYDVASGNIDVSVQFENAAPETFQRFFDIELWEETSGAVDGALRVIGAGGELSGTVELESDGLTWGEFALTRMEAEGGFRGSALEIKRLYAENEVSQISGEGLIDLSRRSDSLFNLEATSIELDTLARLARLPFQASGYGDIFVEIAGGAGEMRGSIEAYEPALADLQFDRMRGQFQLTGDAVTLKRFDFLLGGAVLELRALVPVGDSAESLEVIMNGDGLPLAILNPFVEGAGIDLDGKFNLKDVTITEGKGSFVYGGVVEVEEGVLNYAGLNQPVTGISGLFYLEEDVGAFSGFGGEFGGRRVDITTGGVFFDGLYPSKIEMVFSDVTDASVEYGGFYRGKVDVIGFYVSGSPRRMEIGGLEGAPAVRFHHGTLELSELPVSGKAEGAGGGFELSFPQGVKIDVGDEILLKSGGNLKLYPKGELVLGGSLAAPSLKGTLVSTRGFVRPGYSGMTFGVIEPVVIGFYSLGEGGVIPIFYAHGKARVSGIDVYIESSGPMVDLARIPAYQEFCQEYMVSGVGGSMTASAAPRILVGGEGDVEKLIPVCPSVRLYAYRDGLEMSVHDIMMHLTRADEIQSGTPVSQILTGVGASMFTPEIGTVIEQGINLENFEINLDPNKDLLVELEKRIGPETHVRLKRLFFSQEIQQELEFRYKFRKKSYILWNIDQDNEYKYEVEYRFAF